MSEYGEEIELGNATGRLPVATGKSRSRVTRDGVIKPPRIWSVLAAISLVASVLLSVVSGVSYLTFGLSLLACVLVVLGMLVNRTRSLGSNYSFEEWFSRLSSLMYVSGFVVSLVQIVLVAIDAAR